MDLHVKYKISGKNLRENLQDLRLGKEFLNLTPKNTIHKKNFFDKLDFIKIKKFCSGKV